MNTNRARGQEKPPAWAARGKLRLAHVPGGPARTAELILLGAWDFSPAGLLDALRYEPPLVEELAAKQINAVVLTWSAGFSHEGDAPQRAAVGKLLPLLKRKKIKAIAQIALTNCFAEELFRRLPEAAEWLEHDERGAPLFAYSRGGDLLLSLRHPGCRQFIAEKVFEALDCGFDGFCFDAVLAEPAAAAAFIAELRHDFHVRQPELPEPLIFTSVAASSELDRVCNFKWRQSGFKPGLSADGGWSTNLPQLKLLFESGGREKPFASGLYSGELEPKALKLAVAEILASGGVCNDLRAPAAYQAFCTENAKLFAGGSDPVNAAGVLLNDAFQSVENVHQHHGALAELIRASVPHDIIPAAEFENFEFRKYKVLSAVHLGELPAALAQALSVFVRANGGTLLLSALHARQFALPELDAPRAEHALGAGRMIVLALPQAAENESGWPRADYAARVLPEMRQQSGAAPVTVQAEDGVAALLWGKGTSRWVHVLNYRGTPADAVVNLPGCGGRKLAVFSPDATQPALQVLETGTARASFSLQGLETYCVVEVI